MVEKTYSNFYKTVDGNTETYSVMFDFGQQTIHIKKDINTVINFVHGDFIRDFSRKGNDLIIGSDMYVYMAELLGVGYGKEEWNIAADEFGNYSIEVKKYNWMGSYKGYSDAPTSVETKVMTQNELAEFAQQYELTLNEGQNTIYTTWPVLPNPKVSYHPTDHAHYAPANGKLILKNYFKYGKDNVFIGERLLSEIIEETDNIDMTKRVFNNNKHIIYDTFLSENIQGRDCSEIIYSMQGDDTIGGGKGNDSIYLGEGNKTIVISQGEGRDTLNSKTDNNTIELKFDTNDITYEKSGNNLIINRKYGFWPEQTVLRNFFKNPDNYSQITVSDNDTTLSDNLLQDLTNGDKRLVINTDKRRVIGSDFSDEAYSYYENETFTLGKGNDIIHFGSENNIFHSFFNSFGMDKVNINDDTNLTLDFAGNDINFTYQKDGGDAVITVTRTAKFRRYYWGNEIYYVKNDAETGDNFNVTEDALTQEQMESFQTENTAKLQQSNSALAPELIVIPEPWSPYVEFEIFIGSVTVKDYFKYNNANIYVGDTSLQDIFRDIDNLSLIDESAANNAQKIYDTFLNDTITGSRYADRITSSFGDDTIGGGKGNDKIFLGEGNKILNINKGDGRDSINISSENTSTGIVFDNEVQELTLKKYADNMIITRKYADKTEKTTINNYYKYSLDSSLTISIGDEIIWDSANNTPETNKGIIFEYSADYPIVAFNINDINQNVAAWQADNNAPIVDSYADLSEQNQLPVLIAQN